MSLVCSAACAEDSFAVGGIKEQHHRLSLRGLATQIEEGPLQMTHFLPSVADQNCISFERKKKIKTGARKKHEHDHMKASQSERCILWLHGWVSAPPQGFLVRTCRMSFDTGSLFLKSMAEQGGVRLRSVGMCAAVLSHSAHGRTPARHISGLPSSLGSCSTQPVCMGLSVLPEELMFRAQRTH